MRQRALLLSCLMAAPAFLTVENSPRLGLGLAALGRPGYINLQRSEHLPERSVEAMCERCHEVLDAAHALGLRYFDCARSYGRSEEFLSSWLRKRGFTKDQVAVGSKWGYRYTADWQIEVAGAHEVKDHSLQHLDHQQKETLDFLGDHLRLYQIHSATLESGVLENEGVLDRLRQLREEMGWKVGLSLSGVAQAKTLERALELKLFDSVQATWNLMEQSCGPMLLEAKRQGLEVIIKEGMANGRLLRCEALLQAAEALAAPADALALAAIMAQPFEPMVLSGAVTPQQLESNAQALRLRLEPKVLKSLMSSLKAEPEDYWKQRASLTWN